MAIGLMRRASHRHIGDSDVTPLSCAYESGMIAASNLVDLVDRRPSQKHSIEIAVKNLWLISIRRASQVRNVNWSAATVLAFRAMRT